MKKISSNIEYIIDQKKLNKSVSGRYVIIKRICDVFLAALCIILFLPAIVTAAAALKLNSYRTVFIYDYVYGQKGRIFKLYSFNVKTNSRRQSLNNLNDVGEIIEKTGVKKLPYLFNILKGELSFVGPAPLSKTICNIDEHNSWYALRFSVKPGLICLYTITSGKCPDIDEMVRADLKYIKERNLLYDFKIFLAYIRIIAGNYRKLI
ncbi:MAG TPA: sugar transferase [Clostridiales bacterium]|nr:sugar transferase [Clostridiales bacterium]